MTIFPYVVYMITFPNGKIYIGKDICASGHSLRYSGSWMDALVERDFTRLELADFTVRKTILFESPSREEVSAAEIQLIRTWRSNEEAIGYNRWPKAIG